MAFSAKVIYVQTVALEFPDGLWMGYFYGGGGELRRHWNGCTDSCEVWRRLFNWPVSLLKFTAWAIKQRVIVLPQFNWHTSRALLCITRCVESQNSGVYVTSTTSTLGHQLSKDFPVACSKCQACRSASDGPQNSLFYSRQHYQGSLELHHQKCWMIFLRFRRKEGFYYIHFEKLGN